MKVKRTDLYFLILSILLLTFLRKYSIVIYPILIVSSFYFLRLTFNSNLLILLILIFLTQIINGLFYDFYPLNNLISITLIFSTIAILGSTSTYKKKSLIHSFFQISSYVLLVVDFSAGISLIISVFQNPVSISDAFVGIYGKSGLIMHTLFIVNIVHAMYHFQISNNRIFGFIFFISSILCFFGAGIIIFVIALVLSFLPKKRVVKPIIAGTILISLLWMTIRITNQELLNYMSENLERSISGLKDFNYQDELLLAKNDGFTTTPRKITFHYGAFKRLFESPAILLFGTGPGTYNSRTSFLLNGDYSKIDFLKNNIKIEPKFAKNEVFPLWNSGILFRFNDGTRNEPFSSIIALIIEYGFLFFCLTLILFLSKVRVIFRSNNIRF